MVPNYIIYPLILINLTLTQHIRITTFSQNSIPSLARRWPPQRCFFLGPRSQRSPNRTVRASKIIKILTSTCLNLISWSHIIDLNSYSLYLFIRTNSLRIGFCLMWITIISSSVISWNHWFIVLTDLNFIIDAGNGKSFRMLGISFGRHLLSAGIQTAASLVADN